MIDARERAKQLLTRMRDLREPIGAARVNAALDLAEAAFRATETEWLQRNEALLAERESLRGALRNAHAVLPHAIEWMERLVQKRGPVPADADRVGTLRILDGQIAELLK